MRNDYVNVYQSSAGKFIINDPKAADQNERRLAKSELVGKPPPSRKTLYDSYFRTGGKPPKKSVSFSDVSGRGGRGGGNGGRGGSLTQPPPVLPSSSSSSSFFSPSITQTTSTTAFPISYTPPPPPLTPSMI
jgi:hypothetical protein